MRVFLVMAPSWVQSVLSGLVFGVGMAVFTIWREDGAVWAGLAVALIAGVPFGAMMGLFMSVHSSYLREALTPLGPEQRPAALRGAARGPVPTDPTVRRAALSIAISHLDQALQARIAGLVVSGLAAVVGIVLAATIRPWWYALGAAAAGAALFVALLRQPARLRRRIELLAPDTGADEPPTRS